MSSFKFRVRQKIGALGDEGNFTREVLSKWRALGGVSAQYNHWRGCMCSQDRNYEDALVWFERGAEEEIDILNIN